jgi:hypothetical protein
MSTALLRRGAEVVAVLSMAACLCACGSTGDGGGTPQPGAALRLDPPSATLKTIDGALDSQDYTVTLIDPDGDEHDVTGRASLRLSNPSLADVDGHTVTTRPAMAGRSQVVASLEDLEARAELIVQIEHTVIEPGAPADARDRFDGASAGGASPELVYPDSGILVPPNLNSLELHYRRGGTNDLFELAYVGELVSLRIYTACQPLADGCSYEPSQETWNLLASAGRGESPVFYTLRGLDTRAAAPAVGASEARWMGFGGDDLLGGIYYWNTGGAIMRYEFGLRGQGAETYLSVAQTGATQCVGCHVLSRDGSRIFVGLDIPAPASIETYEVADRARLWRESGGGAAGFPGGETSGGANFASFSPDGRQILTATGARTVLRDATTGVKTGAGFDGTMPDWAPDGSRVVFAKGADAGGADCPLPGSPLCDLLGGEGGIADGTASVAKGALHLIDPADWATTTALVMPEGNIGNYYPHYSPDSRWILFNRGPDASMDNPAAQVWVVPASGGAPMRLGNASNGKSDSWPKWGPFVHAYQGGTVMWFTFSSRRDYGLRIANDGLAHEDQKVQLWMAAFDPARAARGEDGSFTAFRLPFQDIASGNHIAQWAEIVDRTPCETDADCPGEHCSNDVCVGGIE